MAVTIKPDGFINALAKIGRLIAREEDRIKAAKLAKRAKKSVKSGYRTRKQSQAQDTEQKGRAKAPRQPARKTEYRTDRPASRAATSRTKQLAKKAKVRTRSRAAKAPEMQALLSQAGALADQFIEFVKVQIKEDLLKIPAKTPFTKMFEQKQGAMGTSPLFYTGELMEHLIVIRTSSGYAVTWDSKNLMRHANHPFPKDSPPKSALSFVKFIETGRNRQMSRKVRRMLAIWAKKNNVTARSTPNKYPGFTRPRPFFSKAAQRFIRENRSRKSFTISYSNYVLTISVRK